MIILLPSHHLRHPAAVVLPATQPLIPTVLPVHTAMGIGAPNHHTTLAGENNDSVPVNVQRHYIATDNNNIDEQYANLVSLLAMQQNNNDQATASSQWHSRTLAVHPQPIPQALSQNVVDPMQHWMQPRNGTENTNSSLLSRRARSPGGGSAIPLTLPSAELLSSLTHQSSMDNASSPSSPQISPNIVNHSYHTEIPSSRYVYILYIVQPQFDHRAVSHNGHNPCTYDIYIVQIVQPIPRPPIVQVAAESNLHHNRINQMVPSVLCVHTLIFVTKLLDRNTGIFIWSILGKEDCDRKYFTVYATLHIM